MKSPIEIPELMHIILAELDTAGLVLASFVCRRWHVEANRIRQERQIGKKICPPLADLIKNKTVLAWFVETFSEGAIPHWCASQACFVAARHGALESLQWLRQKGAPWDYRTCAWAASGGHLEVLRWARANGCPWNGHTCIKAAEAGHLAVLKWARSKGCPWDEATCTRAAEMGRLELLRWAIVNGCPWYLSECRYEAQRNEKWGVVKWINGHRCLGRMRSRPGQGSGDRNSGSPPLPITKPPKSGTTRPDGCSGAKHARPNKK